MQATLSAKLSSVPLVCLLSIPLHQAPLIQCEGEKRALDIQTVIWVLVVLLMQFQVINALMWIGTTVHNPVIGLRPWTQLWFCCHDVYKVNVASIALCSASVSGLPQVQIAMAGLMW